MGAFGSAGSSGSGVYHSFVRISANTDAEQGYNTSGRPVQYDENTSPTFTKDLPLNRVPLVQCGSFAPGQLCREFDADINQQGGLPSGLLDLLRVRLFISTVASLKANSSPQPNPNDDHFGQSATSTSLVWDLDGDGVLGNVYGRFNYNNASGSGQGDVILLVPVSKFPAAANAACQYAGPDADPCIYFVYLYSQWGFTGGTPPEGGNGANNDGFEEWNTRETGFVTVTKTANTSFTRTHDWDVDKTVDPSTLNLIEGQPGGDVDYAVQVVYNGYTDSDWSVSGTITIHNPSTQDVIISSVADVISGGGGSDIVPSVDCGVTFPHTIPEGGADLLCSYSSVLPDNHQRLNAATVMLEAGGVNTATADIVFSNTPTNEVDESACVTDTNDGQLGCVNASDADNTPTFTYTLTFTCDDDAGNHPNTATITTNDSNTEDTDDAAVFVNCGHLTVTKDFNTSLTRTWNWTIDKSVTHPTWDLFTGDDGTSEYTVSVEKVDYTDAAWAVTGNIHVKNDGGFSISLSGVSDAIDGVGAATVSCPVSFPHTLAVDAQLDCTYSSSLPDASTRTNTATANIMDDGSFSGTAEIDFTDPTITEVNATIHVTDTYAGSLGEASDDLAFTPYSRKFTCNSDEGAHNNTATIDETGQSDDASVTVNCYALDVSKDAATELTRTWTWSLTKTLDASCFLQIGNEPAGFDPDAVPPKATIQQNQSLDVCYNIEINASSADDQRKVSGKITIDNPNPIAAEITTVADVIIPDPTVAVDCGVTFPYTIAANGSLECTYSADLDNGDDRNNKATATLQNNSYDKDGVGTPSGTTDFEGNASVSFASATIHIVDECVDVNDILNKGGVQVGSTVELGTYCADQQLPHTFQVIRSFPIEGIPLACGDNRYDNTATAVTNDNGVEVSDDASINLFVECQIGCTLTLGYWKTHNVLFQGGASKKADPTWYLEDFDGDGTAEGPSETFFLSGQTWFQVFWTKPQGNAYYNLADQYMAAVLNGLGGADQSAVSSALAQAKTLFETYTPAQVAAMKGNNSVRQLFLSLANTLDQYNQGIIGPGHCTENVPS